jgi:hypothetical protein
VKDPTVPSPDNRKKITFYDSPDRQAKLKIRCDFDEITQSQFFRMMMTGYIEGDELIYEFIKSCKERYSIQGQTKRAKVETFKNAAEKIARQFALGDEEVEDIFDIIEMETGL